MGGTSMKKVKISLLVVSIICALCFVVTLFNPFRDDDVRSFEVDGYYAVSMAERETKYDENYLSIEIKNISGEDVFNTEMVFGIKGSATGKDNYIWFRMAKIAKGDTIKLVVYEDTGNYSIDSKKSTENSSTYNIAIDYATEFEVEDCMRITVANVDSDSPKVYDIAPAYWSIEKTITLALTVISVGAFAYVYIKTKKVKE